MNHNKIVYIVYLAKGQNHVIIGENNMAYIEEPNAKYTIKDSVFCDLFTKKEYFIGVSKRKRSGGNQYDECIV